MLYEKKRKFFFKVIQRVGPHCKVQTEHVLWATKTVQTFLLDYEYEIE